MANTIEYAKVFQKELDKRIMDESCCTYYQLHRYAYHDAIYGWHISNLVIYETPKKLSDFKKYNRTCYYDHLGLATPKCKDCKDMRQTKRQTAYKGRLRR